MKRRIFGWSALVLLCASSGAFADDRRYQTSDVIDLTGAGTFHQGAAWLIRSGDEIEGRIMTNVTTAGDAYTLWVIVFNNPEECGNDGCGEDDIGVRGDVSIFNGSGAISAANGGLNRNGKPAGGGVINIDFEVEAGGLPNDLFLLVGNEDGLVAGNGYEAEVWLIIDQHPPVPDGTSWISDLTTTNFPGGPATNNRLAIFLACPDESCPGNVF